MIEDSERRVLAATGFQLPEAYVGLFASGRLKYGESRQDWEDNWKTIVKTSPPALLCSPWFLTVEWRSIDKITGWTAPGNWSPNRFVSFAGNGYGDSWVWDPDRSSERGTPVILCRHDEPTAEIVAASFSDFLYRVLLESFAHIAYDARDELDVDDEAFKRYLELHIQVVAPYLPTAYLETLHAILLNEFVDDEEQECLYLLAADEKDKIFERDLFDGQVGTTFNHLNRSAEGDEAAVAAAREREIAGRRQWQFGQATNDADVAFRSGDYQAYHDLLAPFSSMLTPVQEKKLALALRKIDTGSSKAE